MVFCNLSPAQLTGLTLLGPEQNGSAGNRKQVIGSRRRNLVVSVGPTGRITVTETLSHCFVAPFTRSSLGSLEFIVVKPPRSSLLSPHASSIPLPPIPTLLAPSPPSLFLLHHLTLIVSLYPPLQPTLTQKPPRQQHRPPACARQRQPPDDRLEAKRPGRDITVSSGIASCRWRRCGARARTAALAGCIRRGRRKKSRSPSPPQPPPTASWLSSFLSCAPRAPPPAPPCGLAHGGR